MEEGVGRECVREGARVCESVRKYARWWRVAGSCESSNWREGFGEIVAGTVPPHHHNNIDHCH